MKKLSFATPFPLPILLLSYNEGWPEDEKTLVCNAILPTYCTDGNTGFRCDSDKNSLVIIYMF